MFFGRMAGEMNPAAMPSSADRSPRSFDVDAFEVPDRKQDDWRYTPVERVEEFFEPFTPSSETQIAVTMIDGTALTEGVTYSEGKPGDADTGIVSKLRARARYKERSLMT